MKSKLLILIPIMLLLVPLIVNAEIKIFQSTVTNGTDVKIVKRDSGINFDGASSTLTAGAQDTNTENTRSLINLTILRSGNFIPSGSTINEMKIEFFVHDTQLAIEDTNFFPVKTAWVENIVTWASFNNGGVNLTDYNGSLNLAIAFFPTTPLVNKWFNVTIDTAYAQSLFDGTLGDWDEGIILIHQTEGDNTDEQTLRSSDWSGSEWKVHIDYTPFVPPDITPPTVTVTSPVNNTAINTIPFNFSITVTDDLSSEILCILSNTTDVFDTETTAGGDINLTFGEGITDIQQRMLFNITCYDNDAANNNSRFTLFNLTLDNIFPAITINLPVNNSIIDKTFSNLTIDSSCSDPHAIAFNYSLIDSSEVIVNSSQNTTASADIILDRIVDLKDIETGKYSINFTCVDGHTYTDSKVNYFIKDNIFNKIYYGTSSGNDISISLVYSDLNLCDYGSRSGFDREIFWYDFKSCNTISKSLHTYRYILRDNDNQLRYIKDSGYKAHFVTRDNFITFHLDEAADYTIMKTGKNYIITIKTEETFLDFSNSIGGLNKFQEFVNITIIQTNFTALEQFNFVLPDIIFDSSDFLEIANLTFNLSEDRLLIIRSSLTAEKFNLPQETAISASFIFNGAEIFNDEIRTVSSVGNVGSITLIPIRADGIQGENSLLIKVSETGAGGVNLSTWDININTNMTSSGNEIHILRENRTVTFSSTSFTNITSFTFNKLFNSSTYINIHHLLTADGSTTVQCSINRTENSPFYERFISSSTDVGSSGISYIDSIQSIGQTSYNLSCRNDNANTVTSTITNLVYDLTDAGKNIIRSNQSTNPSTDIENTISFGAGTHEITALDNMEMMAGDSLEIISTVIIGSSSGEQTPRIFITSSKDSCTNSHRRTLVDNNDIATVKFYTNCNATAGETISIALNVEVEAGETVIIKDESLSIFESILLNLTFENVAPLVVIESPVPNEILFGMNKITWMATDGNDDPFTTNISVINSSDTNLIFSELSSDISNITFNFNFLGEGDFTLRIISAENETADLLTGSASSSFTVRFPSISVNLTTPLNNSLDADGFVSFSFATDTGGSNNCSLFIDNTINFINQSINASVGINSFNTVKFENGTHTWLVRCDNSSLTGVSEQFIINILITPSTELSLLICPSTIAGAFILIMIVFIAITFITLALIFNIGVIGLFGSILLMVSTWFISPCSNIFAYILALLSVVLMFFFIFRGFFPKFSGLN